MPRFTGQNKKRRDPRYFLNEGMKSDAQLQELLDDLKSSLPQGIYMKTTFYPSVMYRILRSGNADGTPGNEENGVEMALKYLASGLETQDRDPISVDEMLTYFSSLKAQLFTIKQDMGPRVTPNFEPTPFGSKDKRAFKV
jgi:hypothetical protein